MSDAHKQQGNVGNVGDVIKHTSLVAILEVLRHIVGPLLYAETNAFRHSAPLGREGWQLEQACLMRGSAFQRYQKIEYSYCLKGQYLCSPGIAEQLLGIGGVDGAEFILCEKDSACRDHLKEAIPEATLLADHKDLSVELKSRNGRYAAAVALVDPYQFQHVRALFPQWLAALEQTLQRRGPAVSLVFDFSQEVPEWPRYSSGAMDQLGALRQGSYCLALYANQAGVQSVQAALEDLGWTFGGRLNPECETRTSV